MDTTEKELLAQEKLGELKDALKKSNTVDTVTLSNSSYPSTVIGGGYNITNAVTAGAGLTYNGATGITANPWTTHTTHAGRMELNGEAADLVINGVSLLEVLEKRLNVLIPNPALEKEWAELRELGEQYRKLEKDLKEKAEIWAKLNKPSL